MTSFNSCSQNNYKRYNSCGGCQHECEYNTCFNEKIAATTENNQMNYVSVQKKNRKTASIILCIITLHFSFGNSKLALVVNVEPMGLMKWSR